MTDFEKSSTYCKSFIFCDFFNVFCHKTVIKKVTMNSKGNNVVTFVVTSKILIISMVYI